MCYTSSRTERHTKLRPADVIWHHQTQKFNYYTILQALIF